MKKLNFKDVNIRTLGMSQKSQDSLIKYVFECIGVTNKYYVEFGAVDGVISSNTWYFRNMEYWQGLLLDCDYSNPAINLHKRNLTASNIVSVFEEFEVPLEFDFLCVDVDGNDYWLLEQLLSKYSPRVIMVETNVRFEPGESYVREYNENWSWDGWQWYGASPLAMKKLGDRYGYTPVYLHLDDLILVKTSCLAEEDKNPIWEEIYPESNLPLYNTHYRQNIGLQQRQEAMQHFKQI